MRFASVASLFSTKADQDLTARVFFAISFRPPLQPTTAALLSAIAHWILDRVILCQPRAAHSKRATRSELHSENAAGQTSRQAPALTLSSTTEADQDIEPPARFLNISTPSQCSVFESGADPTC
jgi:hypothetical protein